MSGGSFNYLCMVRDVHGIQEMFNRSIDLAEMAYALEQISGNSAALRDTQLIIMRLSAMCRELDALIEPLEPVWKAVEWERSADWSMDRVITALSEYSTQYGSPIKLTDNES